MNTLRDTLTENSPRFLAQCGGAVGPRVVQPPGARAVDPEKTAEDARDVALEQREVRRRMAGLLPDEDDL